MTSTTSHRVLVLTAGPQMQCGVGQFTMRLREAVETIEPGSTATLTLTSKHGSMGDIWRAVGSADTILCNFPIVAWKRVIASPLLALAIARARRRQVVLIQHEWQSLHWLRRLTYLPALALAHRIIMFSPLVARELAGDPFARRAKTKISLAPLPPNIEAPAATSDSPLRQRLSNARAQGRLVIGHFGSIYPGKQPNALLEIAARLKTRGLKPLVVYIGSFIRGMDNVETDFYARIAELGLQQDVIVSGYVASDEEVFGLFEEIDVFCYPLDEGLTARRSSVLTCVQSGRPVIVTAPALAHELAHHSRLQGLIDERVITLVPRGAGADAYADHILAAIRQPSLRTPFDFAGWWRDAASAVRAIIQRISR